jgi:hypothetical protein
MEINIEVDHEEELDLHIEVTEDISSEDENMSSNQNLSAEVKQYCSW